jgi:hypothetical protein
VSNQATRLAEEIKRLVSSYGAACFYHEDTADGAKQIAGAIDALLALAQPAVSEEVEYEVVLTQGEDDLLPVAGASGPNALAEAMNYARQYVDEGPVEVFEVVRTSVAKLARAQSSSKGDEGMQHE